MSKLKPKFLETYNLETLRDIELSGLQDDQALVYDSDDQKWKNVQRPVWGRDNEEIERIGLQNFSGNQFQIYETLTFTVTAGATNKYRFNADFLWGHNSASNDIRAAIRLDNDPNIKELRIEPKDPGTDQRFQNNILKYFNNLSPGQHTIDLLFRPSSASRVSRVYEAILEVWRCR